MAHCIYLCTLIITDGNFNDWQQSAQKKRQRIQLLWQTVKVTEQVYKKSEKNLTVEDLQFHFKVSNDMSGIYLHGDQ